MTHKPLQHPHLPLGTAEHRQDLGESEPWMPTGVGEPVRIVWPDGTVQYWLVK